MPTQTDLSIMSPAPDVPTAARLAATLVCASPQAEPNDPAANGSGVLFVHGLGSDRLTNADRAAALCLRSGSTSLTIDLRGHGGSSGRLSATTPRQNLADVVAGFDTLAAQPQVDPTRIGVCAASYGATLSVLLTTQRPVARLLLRAPALYTDESLDVPLGRRRPGGSATSPRFLADLQAYAGPMLVVESERDEVIEPDVIQTYLRTRPGAEHLVLAGAAHALTDPAWRARFTEVVLAFFATL